MTITLELSTRRRDVDLVGRRYRLGRRHAGSRRVSLLQLDDDRFEPRAAAVLDRQRAGRQPGRFRRRHPAIQGGGKEDDHAVGGTRIVRPFSWRDRDSPDPELVALPFGRVALDRASVGPERQCRPRGALPGRRPRSPSATPSVRVSLRFGATCARPEGRAYFDPFIAARNSAFDFVLPILERSSSIDSTGESGVRTLRRTHTRLRSSLVMSSSSFRVPLF